MEQDEKYHLTSVKKDRALLIGIWDRRIAQERAEEYLEELCFLAETAGVETVYKTQLSIEKPKPSTYIGSGKVEELKARAVELNAQLIIFDDDMTPTQVRNLEKETGVRVLDRSALILLIFAENARTGQAKTQVELARLEYMLPRLTRLWTHHSRERGGVGLKGAGEQEIETDRRLLRDRITKLKEELAKIEKQSETRRSGRERMVRVALVGYTNVGKSTLMNLLAKTDILAENKLFATLDTTVRKIKWHGVPFLLSDTVGFIRKLPHKLIESFKSTLAEVKEADILLHVVDSASLQYVEQIKIVRETLAEIGAIDKPTIVVFNKIDKISPDDVDDFEAAWKRSDSSPVAFISATHKENIDKLRETLTLLVVDTYRTKYPGLDFYTAQYAG